MMLPNALHIRRPRTSPPLSQMRGLAAQLGRELGAFCSERLEIDIGLANEPELARNSQTSMAQGLDQRRQLTPLEILESAAAGENFAGRGRMHRRGHN